MQAPIFQSKLLILLGIIGMCCRNATIQTMNVATHFFLQSAAHILFIVLYFNGGRVRFILLDAVRKRMQEFGNFTGDFLTHKSDSRGN